MVNLHLVFFGKIKKVEGVMIDIHLQFWTGNEQIIWIQLYLYILPQGFYPYNGDPSLLVKV